MANVGEIAEDTACSTEVIHLQNWTADGFIQSQRGAPHMAAVLASGSPPIVTSSSVARVKSSYASRPAGEPARRTPRERARASLASRARCDVRSCPGSNRPGLRSSRTPNSGVASSSPSSLRSSNGTIFDSHTSANGSDRVRHVCACFACEGSDPDSQVRADRTLIPAAAAAPLGSFPPYASASATGPARR